MDETIRGWVMGAVAVVATVVGAIVWLDVATAVDGAPAATGDGGVYDESDLKSIDYSGLPATTTITAREGTALAARVYESPGAAAWCSSGIATSRSTRSATSRRSRPTRSGRSRCCRA